MPEQVGQPGHEAWRRVDPADRARQFMPFAALRGYYDLVRERERVVEPRREMSEDRAAVLDAQLRALEKGHVARVVYYDGEAYVTAEGVVTRVDGVFRTLTVVKTVIAFDDVWNVELVE